MALDLDELVLGVIEAPTSLTLPIHGRLLGVAGWALNASGIARVALSCNGVAGPDALAGGRRPDVAAAFPHIPSALKAGFLGAVDISRLLPGEHELRIDAIACNGQLGSWSIPFTVRGDDQAYGDWLAQNQARPGSPPHSELTAWLTEDLPSVSVIVDAAGAAEGELARSLDALGSQSLEGTEVIVVGRAGDRPLDGSLLQAATGDLVGIVRAGDVFAGHALATFAANFARSPMLDLVYADHDTLLGSTARGRPAFKPAWSPCLLAEQDYIGRCWLARRRLVHRCIESGLGTDSRLNQRALLVAVGQAARGVGHIASVLMSESEPASAPTSAGAGAGASSAPTASAQAHGPVTYRIPKVSVIIPTRASHPELLGRCLDSLFGITGYDDLEVIVVLNNVDNWEAAEALLSHWPVKVLRWEDRFNWSAINNLGARAATGDLLLFLNDDVVALDDIWLGEMARLAAQPTIGAVGALLRYPNGQLQHGGVWLPWKKRFDGRHAFRFCTGTEAGLAAMLSSNREQSAVTGACILVRRECHEAVAGFDESLALVFNDVDYCLRLGALGYRSVIAGRAVLNHYEGVSRGGMSEERDAKLFMARWEGHLPHTDPFSNPNLDPARDDWVVDPKAIGPLVARVTYQRPPATLQAKIEQ